MCDKGASAWAGAPLSLTEFSWAAVWRCADAYASQAFLAAMRPKMVHVQTLAPRPYP